MIEFLKTPIYIVDLFLNDVNEKTRNSCRKQYDRRNLYHLHRMPI
jgi:hypothetical protein